MAEEQIVIDIPVLIDDVKNYGTFKMARCTYFSIECDDPSPDWVLQLGEVEIPFLMLGISGIICGPLGRPGRKFRNAGSIAKLFTTIEDTEGLFVDTNGIWLPRFLLGPSRRRIVGDVYRVVEGLFREAYRYASDRLSQKSFEQLCQEQERGSVYFSEGETAAFSEWAGAQVSLAKEQYPKDPELELTYRGATGERGKR